MTYRVWCTLYPIDDRDHHCDHTNPAMTRLGGYEKTSGISSSSPPGDWTSRADSALDQVRRSTLRGTILSLCGSSAALLGMIAMAIIELSRQPLSLSASTPNLVTLMSLGVVGLGALCTALVFLTMRRALRGWSMYDRALHDGLDGFSLSTTVIRAFPYRD